MIWLLLIKEQETSWAWAPKLVAVRLTLASNDIALLNVSSPPPPPFFYY